jgi:hypothetical protein
VLAQIADHRISRIEDLLEARPVLKGSILKKLLRSHTMIRVIVVITGHLGKRPKPIFVFLGIGHGTKQ